MTTARPLRLIDSGQEGRRRMSRGRPTVDIDVALRDPALLGAALGDPRSWSTWLATLRAAWGLPLDAEQRERFDRVAGGRRPPIRRVRELWCKIGRGGGKSRMAAAIAVHTALLQRHRLAAGEIAYVLCLSPTIAQADIVFRYALSFIENSPVLRRQVIDATAHEIRLDGNVIIGTHASSYRSVRGKTLVCVILDEVSYLRSEESSNPDVEVYRAVLPSLIRSNGQLIAISTPYMRRGLMFTRHRDFFGTDDADVLVVEGSSRAFNPQLDEAAIAKAMADDPESAVAEWEAEFRSDIAAFLDDALIDGAVDHDRPLELPPRSGITYRAFVDSSGGRHDAFGICIGHQEADKLVIDLVRARASPLDPAEVTAEYSKLLREYHVSEATGDSFGAAWTEVAFRDNGIKYNKAEWPKSKLYVEGLPAFTRGLVRLPNHPVLLRELRLLERRVHAGGKDVIDHGRNGRDDAANVLFGVIALLDRPKPRLRMWSEGPNGCEV